MSTLQYPKLSTLVADLLGTGNQKFVAQTLMFSPHRVPLYTSRMSSALGTSKYSMRLSTKEFMSSSQGVMSSLSKNMVTYPLSKAILILGRIRSNLSCFGGRARCVKRGRGPWTHAFMPSRAAVRCLPLGQRQKINVEPDVQFHQVELQIL
jgi:hypothetical protein